VYATRLLATGSHVQHVHSFPSDHHPATLTWKVIDLTAEQQQSQQQQQAVKSAPWQPRQYLKNVNIGHRHFVGELLSRDKQEAQLLLGDRATRKHAKDS